MLCLFRKARKGDVTALWEKREGLSLGRAASASFREAGPWFSLRLPGKRATTPEKRERREVFGAAALGERTAPEGEREATGSLFQKQPAVRALASQPVPRSGQA